MSGAWHRIETSDIECVWYETANGDIVCGQPVQCTCVGWDRIIASSDDLECAEQDGETWDEVIAAAVERHRKAYQ